MYSKDPPPFGHALLDFFLLDPGYVNLNHGSYGSTPRPVFDATHKLSLFVEANPDYFFRLYYQPVLASVRAELAKMIGAEADECVLVPNTSAGISTVLRNFEWEAGDIVLCTSTSYNSVLRTVHYLGDVGPRVTVSVFPLDYPTSHGAVLSSFRAHLRSLVRPTNKKCVAVINSIGSNPGCLLPWKEMVQICKEEHVWSVIDGAHSLGQELDINLGEVAPDFWTTDCHKWLLAQRPCGVLYVPKRNQHIIKSSIPTSFMYVSPVNRTSPNFVEQFEWNGTIDFTPYLTIPEALCFREWLGGEHKINAYCHDLAVRGGKLLASIFGTRLLDSTGELTLNMVDVQLPFSRQFSAKAYGMLEQKLIGEHKVSAAFYWHNGYWWTRCSAQVFNEIGDFERLGKAWLDVIAEVNKEINGVEGEQSGNS